jgi:hypothetical protein
VKNLERWEWALLCEWRKCHSVNHWRWYQENEVRERSFSQNWEIICSIQKLIGCFDRWSQKLKDLRWNLNYGLKISHRNKFESKICEFIYIKQYFLLLLMNIFRYSDCEWYER